MRLTGLWRHPNFVRLWAAATISLFGSLITRTALPFTAILTLEASAFDLSLIRTAELVPALLVGLAAGAWVDRLRRRPLLIVTDLARAAVLLSIPLAAILGWLSVGQLAVVAGVTSILTIFFDVAYQSYLPTLIRRQDLVEGNSKLTAAGSVAEAAAFSLGGWLVQLITGPLAILIDSLTFLVSALFIRRIDVAEPAPAARAAGEREPLLTEIREGLRALTIDPVLRTLAVTNALISAGYGIGGTVFLLYVTREVGFPPGVLGMVFAVGGASALAGALLAGRLSRLHLGALLIGCLVIWAGGTALVPLAAGLSLLAILLLIAQQLITDSVATIYEINQVSLRQAITPGHLLGRVNAGFRVLELGVTLIVTLLAGVISERVGLRGMLFAEAGIVLLAALWVWRSPVGGLRAMPAHSDATIAEEAADAQPA